MCLLIPILRYSGLTKIGSTQHVSKAEQYFLAVYQIVLFFGEVNWFLKSPFLPWKLSITPCSFVWNKFFPFSEQKKAISQGIGISSNRLTTFRTTVWENNAGGLTLEKMELGRVTPRSKHYAIKYHWFRQFTQSSSRKWGFVENIDTHNQKADLLTKGLGRIKF